VSVLLLILSGHRRGERERERKRERKKERERVGVGGKRTMLWHRKGA